MMGSALLSPERIEVKPQAGPQTAFVSSRADIVVYGGSAGGGKSVGLLLDALRFAALKPVPGYGAVIFRREGPQITNQGGLWDEANSIYPLAGGKPNKTYLAYDWPRHKTRIRFSHMQYEQDKFAWQGAQIPYIGFDELTHFTQDQFFYMLSRNRSTCGVKPRVRGTTNPDPDSWVKAFLAPWVDSSYPRSARSGELRRFIRDGGQIHWLPKGEHHPDEKTVTFIAANIYDNKILLAKDPGYLANLKALPPVERMQLLEGDWNIRPSGNKFKRHWFEIIDAVPASMEKIVRAWDKAGTEAKQGKDPDWTVGCKVGRKDGLYYVLDVVRDRLTPGAVDRLVKMTADMDGRMVVVHEEQEPGSSGVAQIERSRRLLAGYEYHGVKSTGSKEIRANPTSSQAEGGNIKIVRSAWNEVFINELCAFPTAGVHDDQVDALSLAMEQLMPLVKDSNDHIADLRRRTELAQQRRAG
jgi:predicted phage terminase large subunit-like protein